MESEHGGVQRPWADLGVALGYLASCVEGSSGGQAEAALEPPAAHRQAALASGILREMEYGTPCATALAQAVPRIPPYCRIIAACAEQEGRLPEGLAYLAAYAKRMAEWQSNARRRLLYWAGALISLALFLGGALGGVMPYFRELADEMGGAIPASTAFFLSLSDRAVAYPILSILASAATLTGVLTLMWALMSPDLRGILLDWLRGAFPGIEPAQEALALERFYRALACLMRSGLTTADALRSSGKVAGNALVQRRAAKAAKLLAKEWPLLDALKLSELLDHGGLCLVAAHGKSQSLPVGFVTLSEDYAGRAQRSQANVRGPLAVAALALMVMVVSQVYVSIYKIVFSMPDWLLD